MAAFPDIATGITVDFQGGTGSNVAARIDDVRKTAITRQSIPVPHQGTTGGIPKKPSKMYDPGQLELDLHFDVDVDWIAVLTADPETATVHWPLDDGTTPGYLEGEAFCVSFEITGVLDGRLTATMIIEFSGDLAFNAEV